MTLNHRSVKLLYSHAHPSQLLILLCAVRPSIAAGFEAGSAAIHVNLQLQDFNWTRDRSTFHRVDRRVLREWTSKWQSRHVDPRAGHSFGDGKLAIASSRPAIVGP